MLRLSTFALVLACTSQTAFAAESLVAARMIRSQSIIGPQDIKTANAPISGALSDPAAAMGLEARVNIYPGRPILARDLGQPAMVDRNQLIVINYESNGLSITADGRALGRAAAGERIRVMNLASRATVTGTVQPDGSVAVGHVE
jgi:flagella basal body P-ring formation protein FlgA